MAMDINSPLYQSLANIGPQYGATPFDTAGLIGNAQQEGQGSTDPGAGDGGNQGGGFQWRNSRFDNLKGVADELGLPWQHPDVQAHMIYREAKQRGLLGASSVDDAADNGMDLLNPSGWKSNAADNTAVDGYQNRKDNSAQAYMLMRKADGNLPADTSVADNSGSQGGPQGAANPADLPSPDAQTVGGALSPYTQSLLDGQGQPQAAPKSLGDNLLGLSSALLARDNPSAAAAMKSLITTPASVAAKAQTFKTGTPTQLSDKSWVTPITNSSTGQVFNKPTAEADVPQSVKDDAAVATKTAADSLAPDDGLIKGSPGISKQYQTNSISQANMGDLIGDINKFQKLVADNDLSMSIPATGIAEFKNRLGVADPSSDAIKEAQRLQHRISFEYIKQEPGPATKQKIQQTAQIMFPSGSQNSTATYLQAAETAKQSMLNSYGAMADSNDAMRSTYKGIPKTIRATDGTQMDPTAAHQARYDQWNQFTNNDAPVVQQYISRKLANPGQTIDKSASSISNDADYEKLPSGAHFYDPNNKLRIKP